MNYKILIKCKCKNRYYADVKENGVVEAKGVCPKCQEKIEVTATDLTKLSESIEKSING